jgi:hypothetical protein
MRRPSTLIPRPGKEGETIPPKYASASEATDAADGDAVPDTQNDEARTNDMEQQIVEETRPTPQPPRVIVRDFGFTITDPRYRGAFHPIPGEAEDDDDDDDDARSTASGASSGWNRFTAGRRKSSTGGWSGFGFGGFGFGGLSRRFSKSSRRGSQAGLSGVGDDTDSTRSGTGSRRSSVQVGVADATGKSPVPGGIILPLLPHDTDVSLSDLTPSSTADDEPPFGKQYVFGAGGSTLLKRGASGSGSRLRALSGAGNEQGPAVPENRAATPDPDPRLSILSQVSEEAHSVSDSSPIDEAAKWPSDATSAAAAASISSSGTTVTAREPRGRYKVLYEFEAEGEHEMSVAEGEVLLVGGRWGNMGWVIAERVAAEGETVVKGLVPEGYLGEKIADR